MAPSSLVDAALATGAQHGRNPASIHQLGQLTRRACDAAAEAVCALLPFAGPYELIWTATQAEADALALWGMPEHAATQAPRAIVQPDIALPAENGVVVLSDVAALLQCDFALRVASVPAAMATDSLTMLAHFARTTKTPVHLRGAGIWAARPPAGLRAEAPLSASVAGPALGGPTGIAALAVPRGQRLTPLWPGGSQQEGRRPGTLPRDLALGMGVAAALWLQRRGMS